MCCSSWGLKDSGMTELQNELMFSNDKIIIQNLLFQNIAYLCQGVDKKKWVVINNKGMEMKNLDV